MVEKNYPALIFFTGNEVNQEMRPLMIAHGTRLSQKVKRLGQENIPEQHGNIGSKCYGRQC